MDNANLFLENITYLHDARSPGGLSKLTFEFQNSQFYGILGPSGSGKSTLLKIIHKQLMVQSGEIHNPYTESCVFIENNVLLAQSTQGTLNFLIESCHQNLDIEAKVNLARDLLAMFEITNVIDHSLNQLSNGERQRVQVISYLMNSPKLLLFDESFAGIDWINRQEILKALKLYNSEHQGIILWATQNIEDALTYCDQCLVFNFGRLQDHGPGENLYFSPNHSFAARFIGISNELLVKFKAQNQNNLEFDSLLGSILLPIQFKERINPNNLDQLLIIRPEFIYHDPNGNLTAIIIEQKFTQGRFLIKAQINGHYFSFFHPELWQGEKMPVSIKFENTHLFQEV
ncbi:MAG: ATP-binding cassette domain-containing protein [Halobacteriovoraceae bacterium]|nr:ATP-binding cassette domain-containing protein [Halobacteriovoraceae bacterium]MCB9095494.1 ATP-binding cassette domain-containing protein [Halobacteriovoraceae bacterium]